MRISGGVSSTYSNSLHWEYRLTVTQADKDPVIIEYPLTCNFNIVRNTFASSNSATFTILNLAKTTRSKLFQDRFNTVDIKYVKFEVKKDSEYITIFAGYIQECYSSRNGVDIETRIQALDIEGIFEENNISITFEAGTTKKEAYKNIVAKCGYQLGAIGTLEGEFKKPVTFVGKPLDVLNEITGGHTYIDNGVANTLQDNQAIDLITIIDASTGLLGTPERREAQVVVNLIFNPNIVVGQIVDVQSTTSQELGGVFQVVGVSHSGVISGSVAGNRTTTLNLMGGSTLPASNFNVTLNSEPVQFEKVKKEEVSPVSGKYSADAYNAFKFIREHAGNIVGYGKKITERISWREMIKPSGSKNENEDINNQITLQKCQNCSNVAKALTDFINTHFSGRGIEITSSFRTKENNASLSNSSKESAHMDGRAIDFSIIGVATQKAMPTFTRLWKPQYGFTYMFQSPKTGRYYIHVQIDKNRNV